ncbi:hypothetical protein, partial [Veillonella sp.]|uniref:hypothetical protein n=1 Tax=Veillonella sp. TaxID=1926307 RepID=UPI0025E115FB
LYLCQKKIKVLQTQYLSKFAALSTHTFCPITLLLYFFSQLKTRRKKDYNCPLPRDVRQREW